MARSRIHTCNLARRGVRLCPYCRHRGQPEGAEMSRGGSVLLVVLGLLLLLMVLGFTAFTFTSQEHVSAEYYAEAAKPTDLEIDADQLFDYALEQLILGPAEENTQSALWPGLHSLVPNMVGMFQQGRDANGNLLSYGPTIPLDRHPFNGYGLNIISGPNGEPWVDNDHDGASDATAVNPIVMPGTYGSTPGADSLSVNGLASEFLTLRFNYSYAATATYNNPPGGLPNGPYSRQQLQSVLPDRDAGYTYPDINNLAVAHVDSVQITANDPTQVIPVIIPSFHRPQYLRDPSSGLPYPNGPTNALPNYPGWDLDVNLAGRVLRPNPGHRVAGTTLPRFMGPGPDGQPGRANVDDDGNGVVDDDAELGWSNTDDRFGLMVYTLQELQANSALRDPLRDPNGDGLNRYQGVWSFTGPVSNVNDPLLSSIEYDVDNRGSGIRDGIWLDLGAPIITLPDGRKAVPMFSYTVLPADGLINVNTAGNVAGLASGQLDLGKSSLSSLPISQSNFGASPAEINPFWALTGDPQSTAFLNPPVSATNPSTALQQHRAFLKYTDISSGNAAQFTIGRVEMANLESLFLKWGRPRYTVTTSGTNENSVVTDAIEGAWGELTQLVNGASAAPFNNPTAWLPFPRPGNRVGGTAGQTYVPADQGDDNFNQFTGLSVDASNNATFADMHPQLAAQQPNTRYTQGSGPFAIWSFGHPFDYVGGGDWLQMSPSGNGMVANLIADPNNPQGSYRWLQYERFMAGSVWGTAQSVQLSLSTNGFGLLDEPSEMIADRRYRKPGVDQTFAPDEIFALHASQGDFAASSQGSRLRQLAPFNFENSLQAAATRKRFTTDSYDRTQNGFRPDPLRPWEYNADIDGNSRLEFPPAMAGGLAPNEPYRQPVRAAIGAEIASTSFTQQNPQYAGYNRQMRLDINRLATVAQMQGGPPNFESQITQHTPTNTNFTENPVRFRRLTPHPPNPGQAAIPTFPGSVPPNISSAADQEFWARRDRQQMARDIYVMLYTLGGATAVGNPLANGGGQIYQDWQLREMAQFAVNVVDALDPDDVITTFEYDTILSNGWDRDDNPFTTTDAQDRALQSGAEAVVYGVEEQKLTLSEVLCINQKASPSGNDHPATAYDDTVSDRWFTQVELQNISPFAVDLANGGWRISVRKGAGLPRVSSVVFKQDAKNNSSSISAGALYTIGTRARDDLQLDVFTDTNGNQVVRSSDVRVDFDAARDGAFNLVAPALTEATPPVANEDRAPMCNLDLVHNRDYDKNYFQQFDYVSGTQDVSTNPAYRGQLVSGTNFTAGDPVEIVLERRVHLGRAAPQVYTPAFDDDNPWVIVDIFRLNGDVSQAALPTVLNITTGTAPQTDIQMYLSNLFSTERGVPLDRATTQQRTMALIANSVGLQNSNIPATPQRIWQPHFDRDFTSVMDLLTVPLYGPNRLTERLVRNGQLQLQDQAVLSPPEQAPAASVALAKFLQPTHPSGDANFDNRWYRILELFEVPSPLNETIAARYPNVLREQITRVPGKLQLNALSSRENLLALLDDPNTFNLSGNDILDPQRDWWYQFLRSRDGFDPLTQVNLPGSAASHPFRDLSLLTNGNSAVESTENSLLRSLPADRIDQNANLSTATAFNAPPTSFRRMFEARKFSDIQGPNEVDYYSHTRLLRKTVNNSTNRGNVFMVWITAGFFQAYQPDPNNPTAVVIGKELEDQNRRRGFFVVDRSLLEEAYVPNPNTNLPGTFDFRKFIQYRRTLQ